MTVVLLNRCSDELLSLMGVSSFGEMPLFDGYVWEFIKRQLDSICAEGFVVCSKSSSLIDGVCFCENADKISAFLNIDDDENIFVVDSKILLDVDCDVLIKAFKVGAPFLATSRGGEVFGVFCPFKYFYDLWSENKTGDIFDGSLTFSKIKCVERVYVIENASDYKNIHRQIMCSNKEHLSAIAENIFVSNSLPNGDYTIIPPVYIGADVQIEDGAVIGPDTVLYDKVLVASDSNIRRSVIMRDSFISCGCFVDDSVCCCGVSVRRNTAVFSGCVIGADSLISEESVLDSDTLITGDSYVTLLKTGINAFPEGDNGVLYGYSADRIARLGISFGVSVGSSKIGVLSDGENNSTALKLSLLGGLISGGAECVDFGYSFEASLPFYLDYCEMDYGVFVGGNDYGTVVKIVGCNKPFDKSLRVLIDKNMKSDTLEGCSKEQCKGVRTVRGLNRIYIHSIVNCFKSDLSFCPEISCGNKIIERVFKITLSRIGYNLTGEKIVFNINESGTNLSVQNDGEIYNHNAVERVVSHFISPLDNNRKGDSLYLAFMVMKVLNDNEITLKKAMEQLPTVYIAQRVVDARKSISSLASRISEKKDVYYKNGALSVGDKNVQIRYNSTPDNKKIKIFVKASSFESAEEICSELLKIIEERKY